MDTSPFLNSLNIKLTIAMFEVMKRNMHRITSDNISIGIGLTLVNAVIGIVNFFKEPSA